jgi:hypothetical protein
MLGNSVKSGREREQSGRNTAIRIGLTTKQTRPRYLLNESMPQATKGHVAVGCIVHVIRANAAKSRLGSAGASVNSNGEVVDDEKE